MAPLARSVTVRDAMGAPLPSCRWMVVAEPSSVCRTPDWLPPVGTVSVLLQPDDDEQAESAQSRDPSQSSS